MESFNARTIHDYLVARGYDVAGVVYGTSPDVPYFCNGEPTLVNWATEPDDTTPIQGLIDQCYQDWLKNNP